MQRRGCQRSPLTKQPFVLDRNHQIQQRLPLKKQPILPHIVPHCPTITSTSPIPRNAATVPLPTSRSSTVTLIFWFFDKSCGQPDAMRMRSRMCSNLGNPNEMRLK